MPMNSFGDWWKLARLEHAFLVAAAIVAAEALTAKSLAVSFSLFSFAVWFPVFGPFCITAASFIFNDVQGLGSDRANHRIERPLVSRRIRVSDALKASMFLYALGMLLALFVNAWAFGVAFVFAAFSLVYDSVLKKRPLLGNVFIASSMGISFVYGNFVFSPVLQEYVFLFVAVSFFAGIGRELLITLRDVKGDAKEGMRTLPMLLGSVRTVRVSGALFLIALLLTWIPLFQSFHHAYFLLIAMNHALVLYALFLVVRSPSLAHLKKARNLTLLALGAGLLGFASLAL
ncbi:UbiA family prenyltransferase [Candidatus Micrarchaeota archaeon]|nr:UbiA family prenyltransferase [Candidatus Micrarchaeota archaeon]